jgi:hypothetical protein
MYRYLIIAVICGIVGAIIARKKGYNHLLWFVACILVPLLILVLVLLPEKVSFGYSQKCPYCSEIIKIDAKVCRYCGNKVTVEDHSQA